MDVTHLLDPVLTQGIKTTHFFNGRVLTADDLRTEQAANRDHDRQLATALGEGVVHGLEVTRGASVDGVPVVRIRRGLGFNRDGDAVELGRKVELRLVTKEADVPPEAGLFAVCQVPDRPIELTNVGLYVLTIRPASAYSDERAPMTELGAEGVATGCGSRWALEGVRFAVAPLPLAPAGTTPTALASDLGTLASDVESDVELVRRGDASDTPAVRARLAARLSRLRNGAAHVCFGTDTARGRLAAPLPTEPHFPDRRYGALDGMREREELGTCELPLALFYLSKRGVEWVDGWAVRRVPVPARTTGWLAAMPGSRHVAETAAMVFQFQQHVRELRVSGMTQTALADIRAVDFFRFLPPFGLVPILGFGADRGFSATRFFEGLATTGSTPLDDTDLGAVVAAALDQPPIDLSRPQSLQRFRLTADAGGSRPAWVAVVRRGLRAAPEPDDVARTFGDARQAYRSLIRGHVFLPGVGFFGNAAAIAAEARLSIVAALTETVRAAAGRAAAAEAGLLDRADALTAFRHVWTVQNELIHLFTQLDPGLDGNAQRQEFATVVGGYLNDHLTGDEAGLDPAIDAGDIPAAVRAQDAINRYVGEWTGEGIATGTVRVVQTGLPSGRNLVPGSDTPFTVECELENNTDQDITIRIEAMIRSATHEAGDELSGDWAGTVDVLPSGASVDGIQVDSAATVPFSVTIAPPADAVLGEDAELVVTARALPPNIQTFVHTLTDLTVAEEESEAEDRFVSIPNIVRPSPLLDLGALPPGQTLSFGFDLRYTAEAEPLDAPFQVEAIPEGSVGGWTLQIVGASGGRSITRQLSVADDPAQNRTTVSIQAPTVSGQTLQFRVRVSSETLGISTQSELFTLTTA